MNHSSHDASGARRSNPPWWDHQRHSLVALRRSIERILTKHLPPGHGERVLDLGCGDRPYEPLIRSRGFQYIGCDLAPPADIVIEPGTAIACGSGSAGGVVSFQVLEHVWDLDWYLGECRRILSPDGWLLLSTHGSWLYHPHPTDYRRWTKDGLLQELQSRGFKVERVEGLVGPLAWTTQFRALGIRHAMLSLGPLKAFIAPLMMAMNARMVLEDFVTPSSIRDDNACIYVVLCSVANGASSGPSKAQLTTY